MVIDAVLREKSQLDYQMKRIREGNVFKLLFMFAIFRCILCPNILLENIA